MSQHTPFYREIAAHPYDDGPRLVYADWLEERGSQQSEFIRIDCELAQLNRNLDVADTAQREQRLLLASRRLKLLRQRSKGWAGKELRQLAQRWYFERGVVTGVRLKAETLLQHNEHLLDLAPIDSVDIYDASERLEHLSACRIFKHVRHLGLRHSMIGRAGVRDQRRHRWRGSQEATQQANAQFLQRQTEQISRLQHFLNSSYLEAVESLNLEGNDLGQDAANALVHTRWTNQLKALDLSECDINLDLIYAIRESCPRLSSLSLRSCQNPRDWSGLLVGVGRLPEALLGLVGQLRVLNISKCGMRSPDLARLGEADCDGLHTLSIAGSLLSAHHDSPFTFLRMLQGSLFGQLRSLDVSSCYMDEDTLYLMHNERVLDSLDCLAFNNNQIDNDQVFDGNLRWKHLRRLEFSGNQGEFQRRAIGDKGARSIWNGSCLLGELTLRMQNLTEDFPKHLAALQEGLQFLYDLDLRQNELGDAAADEFIKLGPWNALARLDLRQNPMGDDARKRLKARFGYRVLV